MRICGKYLNTFFYKNIINLTEMSYKINILIHPVNNLHIYIYIFIFFYKK